MKVTTVKIPKAPKITPIKAEVKIPQPPKINYLTLGKRRRKL
jgi:hypothetical protein